MKVYAIQWTENYYCWAYWDNHAEGWRYLTNVPYHSDEIKRMLIDEGTYECKPSEIHIVGE